MNDKPTTTGADVPETSMVLQSTNVEMTIAEARKQLEFASGIAEMLMTYLDSKKNALTISGKRYLEFEDWQFIATFFRCTTEIVWTKPLITEKGQNVGYEARAIVTDITGRKIAAAEASCTIKEKRWKDRDSFQLKSMSQTRASAKALRNVFSWVVAMKGLATTPAEEMDAYGIEDVNTVNNVSQAPKAPETANSGQNQDDLSPAQEELINKMLNEKKINSVWEVKGVVIKLNKSGKISKALASQIIEKLKTL